MVEHSPKFLASVEKATTTSAVCCISLNFFLGGITNCSNKCFANKKKPDVLIFTYVQKEI